MTWTVEYDRVNDVVVVRTFGVLALPELRQALDQAVGEAAAHGCDRFLCDDSQAAFALSTQEMADYPKHYRTAGMPDNSRFAVVFPLATAQTTLFQHAISGAGYAGRVCYTMDDAWRWLGQQ